MKVGIARILKQEGFVRHFDVGRQGAQPNLRIILKYDEKREPVVRGIERVSKPGRRIYANRHQIPTVQSGMGVAILSTSRGLVTDREARRLGVGGEVVCHVW
jgi:small subunit ribosomal protein S8